MNSDALDKIPAEKRPDVILVKKLYADKSYRNRQRKWRLQRLEREAAASQISNERYAETSCLMCETANKSLNEV